VPQLARRLAVSERTVAAALRRAGWHTGRDAKALGAPQAQPLPPTLIVPAKRLSSSVQIRRPAGS
jgi:hypothetical protein